MINLILLEFNVIISFQFFFLTRLLFAPDIIAYVLIIISNRPKRFRYAQLNECMYIRELGILKTIYSRD